MIVDVLILGAAQTILSALLSLDGNTLGGDDVAFFLAWWLYFALLESSSQQATLGKVVLGLKVTDGSGNRISLGRASGRHFGKIVFVLTLFVGFFMAGWTTRRQALHDVMADALAVRAPFISQST